MTKKYYITHTVACNKEEFVVLFERGYKNNLTFWKLSAWLGMELQQAVGLLLDYLFCFKALYEFT